MDKYNAAVSEIDVASKKAQVIRNARSCCSKQHKITRCLLQAILDQMNAQSLVLAQVFRATLLNAFSGNLLIGRTLL
jgi:hypothetical protein